MNEVKIKDIDFKLMPNDQEFYFCIDLSGGKRVHRGGHIKAHPNNFISVLLCDAQTPKGKVISIDEVETCESCEKVFPAEVMELAHPDDTALFCPNCKKEGLIEMYKFFCSLFATQFARYQNLIEEGMTEEEISKVFAANKSEIGIEEFKLFVKNTYAGMTVFTINTVLDNFLKTEPTENVTPNPEIEIKFGTPEKELEPNTLTFSNAKQPVLKFCPNGDIFVNGKLTENDKEVVEGIRKILGNEKSEEENRPMPGTRWLLRTLFAELITGHEDFPIDKWIEENCVPLQPNDVKLVQPVAYVFEGIIYSKKGLDGKTFSEENKPQAIYPSPFLDVMLKLWKELRQRMHRYPNPHDMIPYNRIDNLIKILENADSN